MRSVWMLNAHLGYTAVLQAVHRVKEDWQTSATSACFFESTALLEASAQPSLAPWSRLPALLQTPERLPCALPKGRRAW